MFQDTAGLQKVFDLERHQAAVLGTEPAFPMRARHVADIGGSGIRLHPEQILEVDCLALRLQLFRALRFRARTANLPQTTEAERLVIQRVGQDVFREALLDYWGGRCPLTGITEPALLRASHIRPWAGCTDEQRLDVHNGLLLSALWDAAFDRGLISFADDGSVLASSNLGLKAREVLGLRAAPRLLGLRDEHRTNLALHRSRSGL
jgi:hypothetical protein